MTPEARIALEESIVKWKQKTTATEPPAIGSISCPLCTVFLNASSKMACSGCPVFEKTGKSWCGGTPYHEASRTRLYWLRALDSQADSDIVQNYAAAFRKSAAEEVAFLESLRPDGGNTT